MRVISRGLSLELRFDRNAAPLATPAWGEFFDPQLMATGTLYLDEKDIAPDPRRTYLNADEILKERRSK